MRVLFISTIVILFACKKEASPEADTSQSSNQQFYLTPVNTFLALGDSYTIGQSVSEFERFPAQTVKLLSLERIPFENPTYIANTGWSTDKLQAGIEYYKPKKHTIVSLLVGVNDQNSGVDLETYRERLEILVQKAITLAYDISNHVFILSIPDYSATPRYNAAESDFMSNEIDQFNEVVKEVSEKYQCSFLYITDLTRDARYDSSLVSSDLLHPSGKEYERWARLLAPMIKKELR